MEKELFYRNIQLNRDLINEETRETEISFSSEEPVERWFGSEILLHGKENVDLSRLKSVGSLIYGHNPYDIKNIIGPVKRAWITENQGRAVVGFDDDETGDIAIKKAKSGSLRGVSFGYMINKARRIEEDEEWTDEHTGRTFQGPALIGTRWTPYEISMTPIPADATVGIGRELTRSLDGIHIENQKQKPADREKNTMEKDEILSLIQGELGGMAKTVVQQVRDMLREDSKPKPGMDFEAFNEMLGRAAAIGSDAQAEIAGMYSAGKTRDEIERKLFDLARGTNPDTEDTPGGGNLPEGTPTQHAEIRSFKQVDDADFFAGLSNPTSFAVH